APLPHDERFSSGPGFGWPAGGPVPVGPVLFVFPAGIRMVKQPRLPLEPFDRLVQRRPEVRLLYVGPVLDPDEGDSLLAELTGRPSARHVGAVPHAQMKAPISQAALPLNSSI